MKNLLILALLSCSTLSKKEIFKSSEVFSNPESVYFHSKNGYTFVSNVDGEGNAKDGKGYISTLSSLTGKTINKKWVDGLNAPKGMRAHNGNLWVSDIDRVIEINISTGQIIRKVDIPGAKFLNDIAISPEGVVYVSDTIGSKIYKIENYQSSIFVEGNKLESPNGLLYLSGKLYVASWGLTTDWSTKISGRIYWIDISSKAITYITKKPLGNLDGLEINNEGVFLTSDWVGGKIFKVDQEGNSELIYKGEKGLADIGYIPEGKLVIIPSMLKNKLLVFEDK